MNTQLFSLKSQLLTFSVVLIYKAYLHSVYPYPNSQQALMKHLYDTKF